MVDMNYTITPSPYLQKYTSTWILNDLDSNQENQLLGHINAQDYFGTLATVLSLMKQNHEDSLTSVDIEAVNEVVEELTYLQDNYRIEQER